MLLPKGNCLWKGLNTYFVDIRNLIQYIRFQDFNGYIYCKFKNKQAVIFLHEGDSVCGMFEFDNHKKRGMNVVKEIIDSTNKEKNIYLDVHSLSYRSVELITELFLMDVKEYQSNLSADFLNIESYVNNHLSDMKFDGYVEIHFEGGEEGFVSLKQGNVNSIITDSLQIRRDRATQSELRVFDMYALKLFERARMKGATYDIYAKM